MSWTWTLWKLKIKIDRIFSANIVNILVFSFLLKLQSGSLLNVIAKLDPTRPDPTRRTKTVATLTIWTRTRPKFSDMGLKNWGSGQIRINPYDPNFYSDQVEVWLDRVGSDQVRVNLQNPRFFHIFFPKILKYHILIRLGIQIYFRSYMG